MGTCRTTTSLSLQRADDFSPRGQPLEITVRSAGLLRAGTRSGLDLQAERVGRSEFGSPLQPPKEALIFLPLCLVYFPSLTFDPVFTISLLFPLPSVVREGLVGLGHLVRVFSLLDRAALVPRS